MSDHARNLDHSLRVLVEMIDLYAPSLANSGAVVNARKLLEVSAEPETDHPMQGLILDNLEGAMIVRFRRNAIVAYLLDEGPFSMEKLSKSGFSKSDLAQFTQLLGYSVRGWGHLPYTRGDVVKYADALAEAFLETAVKADA